MVRIAANADTSAAPVVPAYVKLRASTSTGAVIGEALDVVHEILVDVAASVGRPGDAHAALAGAVIACRARIFVAAAIKEGRCDHAVNQLVPVLIVLVLSIEAVARTAAGFGHAVAKGFAAKVAGS